nr:MULTISPECIES: hypothetical protein [Lactobacillus]
MYFHKSGKYYVITHGFKKKSKKPQILKKIMQKILEKEY